MCGCYNVCAHVRECMHVCLCVSVILCISVDESMDRWRRGSNSIMHFFLTYQYGSWRNKIMLSILFSKVIILNRKSGIYFNRTLGNP